jgi:hypothetical protein
LGRASIDPTFQPRHVLHRGESFCATCSRPAALSEQIGAWGTVNAFDRLGLLRLRRLHDCHFELALLADTAWDILLE